MNKLKKQSRDQIQMFCLDDLVSKDSFARVIDAFVDAADLKKLGFIHYNNTQGRPSIPTRPILMYRFPSFKARLTCFDPVTQDQSVILLTSWSSYSFMVT